jgi:integrase/recombinase XerD
VLIIPQPKTKDFRELEITPGLRRVLDRLILLAGDREMLLDLTEDNLTRQFRHYVDKAKLSRRLTFHSLRHTFAMKAVEKGATFPELQALMGQRDPESTKRYLHPLGSVRKGVLADYDLPTKK